MWEKRWEEEANKRLCQDCIPSWFLLRICCLSTITAKQHFVTDCLKSLNLRWTHHLPNCWNAICVLLHCWVIFLFVWLAFWRGKFEKGTYTKVITHPHSLLIITYKKKLAELRNGVKIGSMAGTSKELRAVALTSYCYFLLLF